MQKNQRHLVRLAIGVAAASMLVIGCGKEDESAPSSPGTSRPVEIPAGTTSSVSCDTQPFSARSPASVDWAAFHRGGPLLGVADQIGPPPYRQRWTYSTGNAAVVGFVAIVAQTAYVADAGGTLHALNLATGERRWHFQAGASFEAGPLVMTDGQTELVCLGDSSGVLHAVQADTGSRLWAFQAGAAIHGPANYAEGGRVLFGTDAGELFCVRARDGEKLWSYQAKGPLYGCPAIGDALVYIAGCDTMLRAIRLADGQQQFAADMGNLTAASPVIADERLVVGTEGGLVQAFDPATGTRLWSYDKVRDGAMVYASAAISENTAVVGARDGQVHAIDITAGNGTWVFATRGDVDGSPVISASRVYATSKDGRLYVLDLKTGKELWRFVAGRPISAGPSIASQVIVLGDEGGKVYCLEEAGLR